MKKLETIIRFTTFIIFIIWINIASKDLSISDPVFFVPMLILMPLIIFNLSTRLNPRYKSYFTSKYNFYTTKHRAEIVSDLPQDLMFEKMKEVIELSDLKLKYSNPQSMEIMAWAKVNWRSMGETIYIDFETQNDKTVMHFCSVSLGALSSWGKNKSNYDNMLGQFEESLTI